MDAKTKRAAQKYGLNFIQGRAGAGLCKTPWVVHHGRNSGYQALNLAYHLGASKIVLIGYDMQTDGAKVHWHGDHPKGLQNARTIDRWAGYFPALAADLEQEGVEVVNCTIKTALDCFPRADLRDVL